jgi:class 3 adenylate cyclase/tetratricopeptide (TPR) repeat protein
VAGARRERKIVTVLFADLVGFTARSERLDPEDVAAELGRYHTRVREELERHGGTVEKFIGDAAMAIFGAPVAHEDDAERAVRAALAIRAWALDEGIEVRVGINTGEALVTVDARPEAGETMAAGDVVNTAARLQGAAPVNGILVGEQAFRATERAIQYRETAPVDAKGKAAPVPAWLAERAWARVGVDRVHGAALVGRAREVALLEDALARTLADRSSQLVTLVGVPGIGKSRLVLELYESVDRRPELISWRNGRCLPYGEGVTFWAIVEMVKAQVGILEGDGPGEAERKLAAAVSDSWIESHLRPLLGLGGGGEGGGDTRDEAFTAWRRFFEGLADERPLVLVFEDLHWADDHLLDFVDELVEWATGVPLLVVGTARPELLGRRPGWGGGKPNALTISLAPLTDGDTATLLHELLGSLLPAETEPDLVARAGGNPLYAEEFARMLRDRGGLGELPETIQGLIAARLDLLGSEQKALLQDAAVIGKRFWAGALAALDGHDPAALATSLHELERKEFVRREQSSSIDEDSEYAFRHLLVRDVTYGQIPRPDRAEKHLAAARWIERLGRRDDHAEMLAHHYLQALKLNRAAGLSTEGFADAARRASIDAGERAAALNAHEAAVRFFRSALELLPEGEIDRARIVLRLGRSLFFLGAPDIALFEQASAELLQAGDVEGAAEAEVRLCEYYWLSGERDAAFQHLDSARSLVEPRPPSFAKARATALASRLTMLSADYAESIEAGREALAMARQLGLGEIEAGVLVNVGTSRAALGEPGGAAELERAIEVARDANAPFEMSRAMGNLAAQHWVEGELARAARLWQEAEGASEQFGQKGSARWFLGLKPKIRYELGDWDEAIARADEFIAGVEAGAPHYLAAESYSVRAAIRAARGDDANADIERALELARRAKDPQLLYGTLLWCGQALSVSGDPDRAVDLVEEVQSALAASKALGFATSMVHVLAGVLAEAGRGEEIAHALAARGQGPWVRAGIAVGRGEWLAAARILGEIGAVNSQAYCRLAGARAGDLSGLESALAFYRTVGATRFTREGESLLAASA